MPFVCVYVLELAGNEAGSLRFFLSYFFYHHKPFITRLHSWSHSRAEAFFSHDKTSPERWALAAFPVKCSGVHWLSWYIGPPQICLLVSDKGTSPSYWYSKQPPPHFLPHLLTSSGRLRSPNVQSLKWAANPCTGSWTYNNAPSHQSIYCCESMQ